MHVIYLFFSDGIMLCLLYFICENYRVEFTICFFITCNFQGSVYNKKGNHGSSLH